MTVTEVHIGTKFGIENYKADFTSAIRRAIDDTFELASLLNFYSLGIPLKALIPSRKDNILLKCADVVIDLVQVSKSVHGEYPSSVISIDPEWLEEFRHLKAKAQFDFIAFVFVSASEEHRGVVEENLEDVARMSSMAIETVCSVPAMLEEADLEPYILERISEHNK